MDILPTFLGGEVSVLLANVLELASAWVSDLNIAGQVSLAIGLCKLVECFVGNLRDIELVVSNSQQVVVQLLEDGVRQFTVNTAVTGDSGSITKTCTIVKILDLISITRKSSRYNSHRCRPPEGQHLGLVPSVSFA